MSRRPKSLADFSRQWHDFLQPKRRASCESWLEEQDVHQVPTLFETLNRLKAKSVPEKLFSNWLLTSLETPYPHHALSFLERALEELETPCVQWGQSLNKVIKVAGFAPFLGRIFLHDHVVREHILTNSNAILNYKTLTDSAVSFFQQLPSGEEEAINTLRQFKYGHLFQLTHDIALAPDEVASTLKQLSILAQVTIEMSLALCLIESESQWQKLSIGTLVERSRRHPLSVIAMGKLGGEELNYSSDVDLIYVHGSKRAQFDSLSFDRIKRAFVKLTHLLNTRTTLGFGYRVDLRLRPMGQSGDVSLPFDATENYYQVHAKPWERVSLLKARGIAGNADMALSFQEIAAHFVYRRFLDYGFINEMRSLKEKIDSESRNLSNDIKLGPGGIREVEFFIQSLQITYGGRDHHIRNRSTLGALSDLDARGYLESMDVPRLRNAYLLFRKVENALQMVEERQTYQLPESDNERWSALAHACGDHHRSKKRGLLFRQRLDKEREFVHGIFQKLFEKKKAQKHFAALSNKVLRHIAGPMEGALQRIQQRIEGESGIEVASLLRTIVTLAERVPDPILALNTLGDFLDSIHAKPKLSIEILKKKKTLSYLLGLFGTSRALSRFFVSHPELADRLLLYGDVRLDEKRRRFVDAALLEVQKQNHYEGKLDALRLFKNGETLRIALNDLYGDGSQVDVCNALTDLADACIQAAVALAFDEIGVREMPLYLIVGLGKLGGRELGYGSDLDLVFLINEPERGFELENGRKLSGFELMVRVAQKIVSILQLQTSTGVLYRLDTRLRPSGNQGTLVTSEKGFRAYFADQASLWEKQAWLKARRVAGDPQLWDQVLRATQTVTFHESCSEYDLGQIVTMRNRLEKELAAGDKPTYNIKSGFGGLLDIEFGVQMLQLKFGNRIKQHETNTLEALKILANQGILRSEWATILEKAYHFYRKLENRIFLVTQKHDGRVVENRVFLEKLTKAMSLGNPDKGEDEPLLAQIRSISTEVRQVFQKVCLVATDKSS